MQCSSVGNAVQCSKVQCSSVGSGHITVQCSAAVWVVEWQEIDRKFLQGGNYTHTEKAVEVVVGGGIQRNRTNTNIQKKNSS